MSRASRQDYFRVLSERYQAATSKNERSAIITEACVNTGLHRKSIIRALTRSFRSGPSKLKPGRPMEYTQDTDSALQELYRKSEYQCSGKLRSMIPVLLAQYSLEPSSEVKEQLMKISAATIDRHLKKFRARHKLKGRSLTRPGSKLFKRMIPLKNLSNIARGPGILEADTVGHCGGSVAGEFVFSLTMTDEFSGWTANRAVKNKSAIRVQPAIEHIIGNLPFEVSSANFDNGSEFLNHVVYNYFTDFAKKRGVNFPMTRSRSYQKNDNARVEQKNWTHVRQLFGYERIEDQRLVDLMNQIYEVHNLLHNFFVPQYKLISKVRVDGKIRKKHDAPKTPYQRLLESDLDESRKQALRNQYQSLHYPTLKSQKDELIKAFIKLQRQIKSESSINHSEHSLDAPAR